MAGRVEVFKEALVQVWNHWPLLALVPLGQLAHELTHFVVAKYFEAEPVIRIRLRTPMSVVYRTEDLSTKAEAAIGTAPTLIGLTTAVGWLGVMGWPTLTPASVMAIVGWLLYTLPSAEDSAPLARWLGPDEPLGEPERSVLIALGGIAAAAWVGVIPVDPRITTLISMAIGTGSLAYLVTAFYQHGFPEDSADALPE